MRFYVRKTKSGVPLARFSTLARANGEKYSSRNLLFGAGGEFSQLKYGVSTWRKYDLRCEETKALSSAS
jgi:hypothetical protein